VAAFEGIVPEIKRFLAMEENIMYIINYNKKPGGCYI
jgi:hypothetical protein